MKSIGDLKGFGHAGAKDKMYSQLGRLEVCFFNGVEFRSTCCPFSKIVAEYIVKIHLALND